MLTEEQLEKVLNEVLNKHRSIDNERHALHHQYVELQMQKAETRQRIWNSVKASVYGWLIITIITALGWVGTKVYSIIRG